MLLGDDDNECTFIYKIKTARVYLHVIGFVSIAKPATTSSSSGFNMSSLNGFISYLELSGYPAFHDRQNQ